MAHQEMPGRESLGLYEINTHRARVQKNQIFCVKAARNSVNHFVSGWSIFSSVQMTTQEVPQASKELMMKHDNRYTTTVNYRTISNVSFISH